MTFSRACSGNISGISPECPGESPGVSAGNVDTFLASMILAGSLSLAENVNGLRTPIARGTRQRGFFCRRQHMGQGIETRKEHADLNRERNAQVHRAS